MRNVKEGNLVEISKSTFSVSSTPCLSPLSRDTKSGRCGTSIYIFIPEGRHIQVLCQGRRPPHLCPQPVQPPSQCAEEHRAWRQQAPLHAELQPGAVRPGCACVRGGVEEEQARPQDGVQHRALQAKPIWLQLGGAHLGPACQEKEKTRYYLLEPTLLYECENKHWGEVSGFD